ncbi:MAG TPA: glycosyltransferase family 2 protein [Cyclobacteriaceae bacterium]|nr:glycosyltransferase family 2 protein [Cyclobacteriaceae bacterium]HMV10779.1 glycosyltransferase family 2 protein [Cyclobacteriaceae bacterium]HMV88738.1 glycosyltransferase family 2 protein [Cyclobacteriaceae bacterium]HMX02368.1 glycosyltransferase family 2 protein [Cyclobacteriaceae bacterium]HMX51739.1 glycosyltransferase family 2 protein [Cyclobacteriaceae bacterium]
MPKSKYDISIVIPAKDEDESIPELSQWISRALTPHGFSYEVIFIDDGSTDNTWDVIEKISKEDSHIKGFRFNRNYGKSAALQTGFRAAQGDVVITMDADLQDSPDEVPELYKMIKTDGYHLVSGWKKKRNDPLSKTIPSKFFNKVTSMISGIKLHDFNCGLKAYDKKVIKNISVYGEMHRYIPVIAKWAGFKKIGEKVVEHRARKYGSTKFGWERFMNGFLDLLSITFVSKFRQKPMHFFGLLGTISFLVGFVITAFIFWNKIDASLISKVPLKRAITDQPLFYVALVAIVIGVQLFVTGFLAEMLAMQSLSSRDYLVINKAGVDEDRP